MLNFKKDTDANLLQFGLDVFTKMNGNTRYTTEQNQVQKVETAYLAYQKATTDASDRGRTLIQIRNEKR